MLATLLSIHCNIEVNLDFFPIFSPYYKDMMRRRYLAMVFIHISSQDFSFFFADAGKKGERFQPS